MVELTSAIFEVLPGVDSGGAHAASTRTPRVASTTEHRRIRDRIRPSCLVSCDRPVIGRSRHARSSAGEAASGAIMAPDRLPELATNGGTMTAKLRMATPEDADVAGRICCDAFAAIAAQHNFPADFPAPEFSIGLLTMMTGHPGFYGVVAERDGEVVGSNFLDERNPIAGVGPITVDPVGAERRRRTPAHGGRARTGGGPRLRRCPAAAGRVPLPLALPVRVARLRHPRTNRRVAGLATGRRHSGIRHCPATADDVAGANALCVRVHGHDRGGELTDAISQGTATVVEHDGRITGYTTGVAFFGHTVGESNDDIRSLIGAVTEFGGPGVLVPTRNSEPFPVVPRPGPAHGRAVHPHEHRVVQRAGRSVAPVNSLLMGTGQLMR